MGSGIEGINGSLSAQINKLVQELNETSDIVRDVFQRLADFQKQAEKDMDKELLQKMREAIERLKKSAKNVGAVAQALVSLQDVISDLKIGGLGSAENAALTAVQKAIKQALEKLE